MLLKHYIRNIYKCKIVRKQKFQLVIADLQNNNQKCYD